VADIYARTFARRALGTKYWIRPITRLIPPRALYALTSRYVDAMWPIARMMRRLPGGRVVNWRLLIADYSDLIDDERVLREWAKLDTFDMLAPRYDRPARGEELRRWCARLPLTDLRIHRGYNGWEIRARRLSPDPPPARGTAHTPGSGGTPVCATAQPPLKAPPSQGAATCSRGCW
jgi:hypothetical protein